MVKIVWTSKAFKQLNRIDVRYRKQIKRKVDELTGFPLVDLDIKKLHGKNAQYRLRVGDYRIIFEIIDDEPRVLEVNEVLRRTSNTY